MSIYPHSNASLRILDACGNRAAEGFRTIEEYARFVLEDRFLSETAKQLRHDLQQAMNRIDTQARLTARSVGSDCGTTIEISSERNRSDLASVVNAAIGRTQEALRCIEEYGKTLDSFDSQAVESLRYRTYTLAATLSLLPMRVERMQGVRLYLLIETEVDDHPFGEKVDALFQAGVDAIQLRDKQVEDRRLYECAKIASEVARRLNKCFIVNDRVDIALAVHASGVHLGQEELPIAAARRLVGDSMLIGHSTHSIEQARASVLEGADYIGCGPTYPSQTKSFREFTGLPFLRQIVDEISLPAFAIGGINESNLMETLQTGIHGVALSGAIMNSSDPMEAAHRIALSIKQRSN
jgi:thiamine-phosphate pyrophosphorylase